MTEAAPLPSREDLRTASLVAVIHAGQQGVVWTADGVTPGDVSRWLRELADAYDVPVDYRSDDPDALPPPGIKSGDYWQGRPWTPPNVTGNR